MLTDREIIRLADDAYAEFLTNFLIECDFELLSLNKFLSLLEKTAIQDVTKSKGPKTIKKVNIPVLVVYGDTNKVYFCKNVLVKMIKRISKEKQRLFIKALTLHELYHIVNNSQERNLNIYNFVRSEKIANTEFREDYLDLAKVLDEVKKRTKFK